MWKYIMESEFMQTNAALRTMHSHSDGDRADLWKSFLTKENPLECYKRETTFKIVERKRVHLLFDSETWVQPENWETHQLFHRK